MEFPSILTLKRDIGLMCGCYIYNSCKIDRLLLGWLAICLFNCKIKMNYFKILYILVVCTFLYP